MSHTQHFPRGVNVLVRKGKGPEGRSRLAGQPRATLGPGSPLVRGSPSGAKEKVWDAGFPWFCRPFRGLTKAGAWCPRAGALG